MHRGGDVIPRRPRNVDPADIRDGEAARVAAVVRVDARRDVDGLVHVLGLDVGKGDVLYVARPAVRLDPRRVRAVCARYIIEDHVVDVVCYVARVPERPDRGAPGLVAVHVVYLDVGAVAFDGYAVLRGLLGMRVSRITILVFVCVGN